MNGVLGMISALLLAFAPAAAPGADPASEQVVQGTLGAVDDVVLARADLWWVLLFVPLAALAFVWAARQRRNGMRALGNPALVERLVATVHHGNRLIAAIATVAAILCLGVGLMRVQYGGTAKIIPAAGLDIVLAVDYSKSMLARDVYPSRSERLEAELRRFLDRAGARGDRVGVVVFAGAARGLPLSRDMRLIKLYLEKADPLTENPGGTAIGKALRLALTYLIDARRGDARASGAEASDEAPPSEADQVIVLLTDGEDTTSRPKEMAAEAARLGIRLYTVAIGSRSGEPIQKFTADGQPDGYQMDEDGNYLMTRVDEPLLKELAESTGGRYVHVAPDRFGLDEVEGWMGELSRAQREDTVEIHRDEGFVFLVVPALLFLSIALALGERRRVKA
ncbi:MAG: VWA domain-containing protein [Myxococcales bacterium]|nr:VWA domain-containing protein [Myxococcales bacterium]MCB9567546.1 VWA domain-containing protein [Myxococcales bacterium]MCB9700583.1 VWA domain-containing protein [Myxococcales bacterium]